MPVHFIDNYPRNDLASCICKPDKSPLYGEMWVYQEMMKFNDNGFLAEENWYVKHNYNLSSHPFSEKKVEGQIDFIIVSKYGILIIEVKGGAIEVDRDDVFYSYDGKDRNKRYEAQNPFNQVKEYVHSLRALIDSSPFVYRAVIFPHEANFRLHGPQLSGYDYLFFSKADLERKETEHGKNQLFFDFLVKLAKISRRTIIEQLHSNVPKDRVETRIWEQFPLLGKREIDRLRSELFPQQTTYGFDPERVRNDIILEENYEILKGLRRNRKVMVQGGPGTGKTVLATKFLAENLIKQHKGIYFCANQLLRAKMRHLICEEYRLDPNLVSFRIYHWDMLSTIGKEHIDFIIIDEAQEFFDKGLDALIEQVEIADRPKCLILYDPEQAIIQNFKDIDWYADFLLESSFVHYLFDTTWRCTQNKRITDLAQLLQNGQYKRILKEHEQLCTYASVITARLEAIKGTIDEAKSEPSKYIILVESHLIDEVRKIINDYFNRHVEELSENNINLKNLKLRFTTPIKFRGLESENVILITSGFNDRTKIENYIAVTRAIYSFKCIIWN
ncbi:NERD domain-containing protein [Mucilaginibacter sp.]|jgi:hypothetical protein|uniref:NERD domain-containing protein n=1 Tax=Mucilaginibacter sp. TaxID=1882438 RepID=UPI002C763888|nr:NERD domain-containing protein [Mucilaginibacter sp.]HTI58984.1 NERD domain-containing protein [Mucilaginibacter sp.]